GCRNMCQRSTQAPSPAAAFAGFFFLLCGISVLRPVRDQAGIAQGVVALPAMFGATFVAMMAGALLVAWLAARLPRSWYIPLTYRVFGVGLVVACIAFQASPPWAPVSL